MAIDYIWEGQKAMPTVPYSPATGLDNANNIFYVSSRATKTQPGQWIPVGPNDGVVFETNGIPNPIQNVLNLQNTDGSVTLVPNGLGGVVISGAVLPWLDVRDFGAKWDGVTDDTIALQNTIDAAYNSGVGAVMFPSGTGLISGTLNITAGVKIFGWGNLGPNASKLYYTGSGTAINIQSSSIGSYLYAVVLKDFGIYSSGSGTVGISVNILSEGQFDHIFIGANGIGSGFATGIYFSQSGLIEVHHAEISYCGVGMWFDSYQNTVNLPNAEISVHDSSFYAFSEAAFKVNSVEGLTLKTNWIEAAQYVVEMNNNGNNALGYSQLLNCQHVVVADNYFLLANPPAGEGTYSVRYPLYFNAVTGKLVVTNKLVFERNNVFIADVSSPAVAYPFQMLAGSVNEGSTVFIDIVRNVVNGSTTGLYEVNNPVIQLAVEDNVQLAINGQQQTSETDSSTASIALTTTHKGYNGTLCVGNQNFKSNGETMNIFDGSSSGVTSLHIYAGAAQGVTSFAQLLSFVFGGNTVAGVTYNGGELFLAYNGALALMGAGSGSRWLILTTGSETGSNAGTDLNIDAYDDSGTFLFNVLSIKRSTGIVGLNTGVNINCAGVGSTIQSILKGTATFGAVTSIAISFANLGAATYQVSLTAVGGQTPLWVTGKSATGFTINTTPAFTGSVDWILML